MNPSTIGHASVTVGSPARQVVHRALAGMGWSIRAGSAVSDDQLEIIDLAAFRACSESEREARFPTGDRRAGGRACVLVCRPEEFPDAPHDRFDAVVTEPLSVQRLTILVTALFPPIDVAGTAER